MMTFVDKPLTAEQELLMRNVEAIARNEDNEGYWLRSNGEKCDAYINGQYFIGVKITTCDQGGSDACASCWFVTEI